MKIFISHSSKDKWAARRISQDLNGLGAETFLDEKDIKTGESIDESIKKHLKGEFLCKYSSIRFRQKESTLLNVSLQPI